MASLKLRDFQCRPSCSRRHDQARGADDAGFVTDLLLHNRHVAAQAAAVAGILTIWVERKLIGAEGPAFEISAGQRVLLAAHVIWFYLGKLFWPSGLVFTYPRWNVQAEAPGW